MVINLDLFLCPGKVGVITFGGNPIAVLNIGARNIAQVDLLDSELSAVVVVIGPVDRDLLDADLVDVTTDGDLERGVLLLHLIPSDTNLACGIQVLLLSF